MKKVHKGFLACAVVCAIVGIAATVVSNRLPLYLPFLQSDMDGGNFSLTNLNKLDANGITNRSLTASALKATDANKGEKSVTIGTGINYDGTTLSATSVGSSTTSVYVTTSPLTNHVYATNVDSGGTLSAATIGAFTGDITTPGGSYATTLATVNANTGTFGDATHVAQVTLNGKGLTTAASSVLITGTTPGGSAGGVLSGTYPNPTFGYSTVTNGMAAAVTVSNQFRVDATHAFVASNATASALASFDGANNLTSAAVSVRLSFSANVFDLASGVVTPGTYRSVTVDTYGRTTGGTDPTTFSGYAISDSSANLFAALTDYNGNTWTNLNGNAVKGGTKVWQFDASYLWPGDTLSATWTTNTPGTGSSSIQSAGPSIKAWQFSTSATNQVLLQVPMPADWDQSTVNVWINLVSGTNSAVANAITNTWGCSAARVGTALGTAIIITNNLPGGTALIETNFNFNTLTIAGSPKPGDYCLFQIQGRGGVTPFSSTNTLLLTSVGIQYNVTNIQNNAITWP